MKGPDLIKNNEIYYKVSERFQELREMNLSLDALENEESQERLTYKQRAFVNHYCNNLNGEEACVLSGTPKNNANQLAQKYLSTPKIQQAIIKRLNALAFTSAITKETIIVELFQIYENLVSNPTQDYALQLKALEIISRLQGYYSPISQINIQDNSVEGVKITIVNPNE
jgi:hypothetical protein